MGSLSSTVQSLLWIREQSQQRKCKDNECEKYSVLNPQKNHTSEKLWECNKNVKTLYQ